MTVLHRGLVSAMLAIASCAAAAQDVDPFANVNFDELFNNSFDDAHLSASSPSAPGHFRFQLSQQLSGHINRHDTRHHGLETNRTGLNVRYQNPFASGWLLQGSAQARLWAKGDYEYNSHDRGDGELRLNELFIQRSGARHSFSFGRQTVVWGETVGNSVLDVINTTEFRDLSIIDIEDARLNQWLLVWDLFGEHGNWSSFLNLYPEFDPLPVSGSPLYPQPQQILGTPLRLSSYDRDKALFEVGTRWSRSFTGSDISFMAAWLYENPLRFTLPQFAGTPLRPQSHINDHGLLGFSANRALGRLLLTLDLAFSHGVLSETVNTMALPGVGNLPVPGFTKRNRMAASGGFEYGISPTQQISLSVSAQHDQGADMDARGNLLMRYSNNLRNNELTLSATLQTQLDGDARVLFLGAEWRISDNWELESQLVMTQTRAHTPLYFLDEDVRADVTVKWNFQD